jgi:three-Cys-motif partner protein
MAQPSSIEWPSEPRTLLKHQIYKQYADCWMGKILQRFPSATIVDAFAGPGAYSDGPDGSPLVIAKAFLGHSGRERFKPLRLICNESRTDRNEALRRRIDGLPAHPSLKLEVLRPAAFDAALPEIEALANRSGEQLPTLWILDPFDIKSLSFDLVKRCLSGPRDEVLVTWFADEIYRFCQAAHFQESLTLHYGGEHWRDALEVSGEHERKEALIRIYQDRIESLPNVKSRSFAIASKNETARYSIVYATHSDAGLACWNPVTWGLDPAAGRTASERRGAQDALFDERAQLRTALDALSGTAAPFAELQTLAVRLGFVERQLRSTLDEMMEDGRAIRETPLDARSPWPEDCVVRFYEPPR